MRAFPLPMTTRSRKIANAGKKTIEDLAIFGGVPTFPVGLHVNRPNVGDRAAFLSHFNEAWDRRWFTNDGPLVRELERQIAAFLHVKHCVATCNGTAALALVLRALNVTAEVILPSFTFVSTAHTLLGSGIKPVFCDIDRKSWNIDCDHCEQLVTERTTAIVATHLWGRPCDIRRLEEIAKREEIHLILDAAHAFGCSYEGQMIGRFGNAEVFSFHATKVFHTFEGGAVTTDDDDLAGRLKAMRNFGFTAFDKVEMIGTNAKMSEMCAAMGLANLQSIDHLIEQNRLGFRVYERDLEGTPGLFLRRREDEEKTNYQYICVDVEEKSVGLTRDEILKALHAERVIARRYFYPGTHAMEPYRSLYPEAGRKLPATTEIINRTLLLPGGAEMSASEIHKICDLLRFIGANAAEIRAALAARNEDGLGD